MQNVNLSWKGPFFLAVFLCFSAISGTVAGTDGDSVVVKDASITGFFAFQSPSNSNYIVFVINVPDLYTDNGTDISGASLKPGSPLSRLTLQINVDNSISKDNIEDLIILAAVEDGMIKVYSPGSPEQIRMRTLQGTDLPIVQVSLTGYQSSQPSAATEIKAFVSHQNDHFYLDLDAFRAILGGTFASFNNPNPPNISFVIEVPKSLLGDATINAWATSNIRM